MRAGIARRRQPAGVAVQLRCCGVEPEEEDDDAASQQALGAACGGATGEFQSTQLTGARARALARLLACTRTHAGMHAMPDMHVIASKLSIFGACTWLSTLSL